MPTHAETLRDLDLTRRVIDEECGAGPSFPAAMLRDGRFVELADAGHFVPVERPEAPV